MFKNIQQRLNEEIDRRAQAIMENEFAGVDASEVDGYGQPNKTPDEPRSIDIDKAVDELIFDQINLNEFVDGNFYNGFYKDMRDIMYAIYTGKLKIEGELYESKNTMEGNGCKTSTDF